MINIGSSIFYKYASKNKEKKLRFSIPANEAKYNHSKQQTKLHLDNYYNELQKIRNLENNKDLTVQERKFLYERAKYLQANINHLEASGEYLARQVGGIKNRSLLAAPSNYSSLVENILNSENNLSYAKKKLLKSYDYSYSPEVAAKSLKKMQHSPLISSGLLQEDLLPSIQRSQQQVMAGNNFGARTIAEHNVRGRVNTPYVRVRRKRFIPLGQQHPTLLPTQTPTAQLQIPPAQPQIPPAQPQTHTGTLQPKIHNRPFSRWLKFGLPSALVGGATMYAMGNSYDKYK